MKVYLAPEPSIDLGTLEDVYRELVLRSQLIDPVLEECRQAHEAWKKAYALYKRAWAAELLTNPDRRITTRKTEAEARNIDLKVDMEQKAARRDIAHEILEARRDQLSAAQTRAAIVRLAAHLGG